MAEFVQFSLKTAVQGCRMIFDKYLLSVHAQVGCPSWDRDTSFCEFNEVFLNSTGNLECIERNTAVCNASQMIITHCCK